MTTKWIFHDTPSHQLTPSISLASKPVLRFFTFILFFIFYFLNVFFSRFRLCLSFGRFGAGILNASEMFVLIWVLSIPSQIKSIHRNSNLTVLDKNVSCVTWKCYLATRNWTGWKSKCGHGHINTRVGWLVFRDIPWWVCVGERISIVHDNANVKRNKIVFCPVFCSCWFNFP